MSLRRIVSSETFQSTPLMRGETSARAFARSSSANFNPLPSCEGRPRRADERSQHFEISIHSPHARGDLTESHNCSPAFAFQSTPLMRGETL